MEKVVTLQPKRLLPQTLIHRTMNEENLILENEGLVLNEKVKSDLLQMAKLAKIMVALFYVGIVISLIIFAIRWWAFYSSYKIEVLPVIKRMAMRELFYDGLEIPLFAALMVYPAIKFVQFASGIKKACFTNNASDAAQGFKRLRSFFRYNLIGIIFIFPICFFSLFVFVDLLTMFLASCL